MTTYTNKKMRVEQLCSLDIRKIKKERLIDDGWIDYYLLSNGEYLEFRAKMDKLILLSNRQVIPLDKINCNYGGFRYRFRCPQCDKSSEILYDKDNEFLCRKCHKLPYSCQIEGDVDQLIRKIWKIRKRLGASSNLSEPILSKPKYMHWKTFMELRQEENILSQRYAQAVFSYLRINLDS